MKPLFALVRAAGVLAAGLLLSANSAEAAFFSASRMSAQPIVLAGYECKFVKVDPSCWGDICPTRRVCRYNPYEPYRPGKSTTSQASQLGGYGRPYVPPPSCGPCENGVMVCTYRGEQYKRRCR